MSTFLEVQPTRENHWRALALFGRNVASYKFALGQALLELKDSPDDRVALEDVALPYATALCNHLKTAPKQITSTSSQFLDRCREFNEGVIGTDELRDATVQLGFNNVIDAFHRLGPSDIQRRFFVDERKDGGCIRLTDELRALGADAGVNDLMSENDARWRLVETAWELGLNRSLIAYDDTTQQLIAPARSGRVAVTSSRAALNGYQKGHCFYCFSAVQIAGGVDVDHFFPWSLRKLIGILVDGVWNLVLACPRCNRGPQGKFDLVPERPLLQRLHQRNEFLIGSHHPLRETLIAQTGASVADRVAFLQTTYEAAVLARVGRWAPTDVGDPVF